MSAMKPRSNTSWPCCSTRSRRSTNSAGETEQRDLAFPAMNRRDFLQILAAASAAGLALDPYQHPIQYVQWKGELLNDSNNYARLLGFPLFDGTALQHALQAGCVELFKPSLRELQIEMTGSYNDPDAPHWSQKKMSFSVPRQKRGDGSGPAQ